MDRNDRPGRVVVGVDDTLSGLQALRRAVAEARMRGLALHAVRACPGAPLTSPAASVDQRLDQVTAASRTVARVFTDTLGGLPTDVTVETVIVPDAPGPVLVGHANRDDDVLVVGTSRRRFWRRLPRRGITHYCVTHATCPVLVVPPPPLAQVGSARSLVRELRRDLDGLTSRDFGRN